MKCRDLERSQIRPGLRIRSKREPNVWGTLIDVQDGFSVKVRWDDVLHVFIYSYVSTIIWDVLVDAQGEPVYVPDLLIDFP
jgi:hypothetical protein